MTYELLKNALKAYRAMMPTMAEQIDPALAMVEAAEQAACRYGKDVFEGECYVVNPLFVINHMNEATYDVYGRLVRANNGTVTYEQYASAVMNAYIDGAAPEVIRLGYDTVSALWDDNEQNGCNTSDGSFNPDEP